MVTDFKTSSGKDSELFDILHTHFGKTINLSRLKFMAKMMVALVTLRTVNFVRLSTAFCGKASAPSSMRRIQRFMSGYDLDLSLVAKLIFNLLPHKGPYVLSMDRTNWRFGSSDINALVLAVTYRGVAFPLLFRLLPKKGNSNTKERIDLMERYIKLFGKSTIDCLVAYRVGILMDQIKQIRTLNNGHKAMSFFKYGLDTIASALLNTDRQPIIKIFEILSCT